MSDTPRVLALGDSAASLELGRELDPERNGRVRAFDEALRSRPFSGLVESVPTYRSLLVVFDPARASFPDVRAALLELTRAPLAAPPPGRPVEVPVAYGGENGPDLEELARARGLTPDEVVAQHATGEYTAFMLGFKPGFAYLGLLPPSLETPRRATPRVRVPAGAVAIAGRQTGIYPAASAGGWNLIGRAALRLFDPERQPPTLIGPGDRVRFQPVARIRATSAYVPSEPAAARAVLEVLDGGLLTTVQDAGRVGFRRLGVASAGAVDRPALAAANLAVGNAAGAAGLELTLGGPTLRFLHPARFAIAGADLGAVLERPDLGAWPVPQGLSVLARPGNRLVFRGRSAGCRAYLAIAGGIDVPRVLGSLSTDLGAGFGGFAGRPLRGGDVLGAGLAAGPAEAGRPLVASPPVEGETAVVRVVLGPQREDFAEDTVARFLSETWRVGSLSDRVACRLEGARLAQRGPGEIVSDGMVQGSIQVPPDGQPIVMLADGPTTGGYPKIATVVSADLPILAQLVPGEGRLRCEVVDAPSPPGRSARE